MKKTMTLTAALLSGFILLSSACAKSVEVENPEQADNARIYHATVKNVHDGDTIRVTDSHGREIRIRMAYIDAPELNQAHGQSSRDALRTVLQRQNVQIEVFDTDQYGRQVARVLLDGRDVNVQQIRQGNAWHYRSIARGNFGFLHHALDVPPATTAERTVTPEKAACTSKNRRCRLLFAAGRTLPHLKQSLL